MVISLQFKGTCFDPPSADRQLRVTYVGKVKSGCRVMDAGRCRMEGNVMVSVEPWSLAVHKGF